MPDKIILKCIYKKYDGKLDWINLAQDRDKWRAFGKRIMSGLDLLIRGISGLAVTLLCTQLLKIDFAPYR
jgi:hypothetical protein